MKSLLVDALRKANGRAAPEPEEESVELADSTSVVADVSVEPGFVSDATVSREAALIEPPPQDSTPTGGADKAVAELPELVASLEPKPNATFDNAAAAAASERPPLPEPPIVDPALKLPSLDIAEIELEAEHPAQPDADSEPVAEPAATGLVPVVKGDGFATLARWSPALCVVVLSAAAGSLVVYQNITAHEPRLSTQASLPSAPKTTDDVAVTPVWQTLAETNAEVRREQLNSDPVPASSQPVAATQPPAKPASANGRVERPAAITRTRPDPYFDEVRNAYTLFLSGDDGAAIAAYQAVLEKDRLHRQALSGLAAVLHRSSRAAETVALYERMLSIDPDDSTAAAALVTYATDAETRIKSRLQREPDNAAFHFALGLVMSQQARWAEAFESFSAARMLKPGNADYGYNAAVSAQQLGRNNRARELYSEALAVIDSRSVVDRHTVETQLRQLGRDTQGTSM